MRNALAGTGSHAQAPQAMLLVASVWVASQGAAATPRHARRPPRGIGRRGVPTPATGGFRLDVIGAAPQWRRGLPRAAHPVLPWSRPALRPARQSWYPGTMLARRAVGREYSPCQLYCQLLRTNYLFLDPVYVSMSSFFFAWPKPQEEFICVSLLDPQPNYDAFVWISCSI